MVTSGARQRVASLYFIELWTLASDRPELQYAIADQQCGRI